MDAAIERFPRRFKSRSWPLGAARFRLFTALRSLGFRREAIETRIRIEIEDDLARLRVEAELTQSSRFVSVPVSLEAKAARERKEAEAYARMSETERAAWDFETKIVEWISC